MSKGIKIASTLEPDGMLEAGSKDSWVGTDTSNLNKEGVKEQVNPKVDGTFDVESDKDSD